MEYIDKSTFNKLTVSAQVKVVNQLLNEGLNIKQVCNTIGISYSTIRDRFHRANFSFNKFKGVYENTEINEQYNSELEKKIEEVVSRIYRNNKAESLQQIGRAHV